MRLRNAFTWSLALLVVSFSASAFQRSDPLLVRVGIVSYQDFGETFEDYQKNVFSGLMKSKAAGRPVVFRIAVGTYGDVLDWYNRNLIDIALLTPEPVAELISAVGGAEKLRDLYVATRAIVPVKAQLEYRDKSICVVNNNSPVHSFEQLKEWAQIGRINFLFVHPLSVSGSILPRYLLSLNGITSIDGDTARQNESADQNTATWTFDEEESLTELAIADKREFDENDPRHKIEVAFISGRELNGKGRMLPFPDLDKRIIPQEVVLINRQFMQYKQLLKDLFKNGSPKGSFKEISNWLDQFGTVREWVKAVGVSSHDVAAQKISLSQIGDNLRNFEFRYHKPARLALVLSGGGAKCSYQLGAIEALESELQTNPQEQGEKKVDIDLVVGTSGGAINALCAALGLTREEENQHELEKTWESFDQRQFLRPWSLVRILLGVLIGLLEAMLVLRLALLFPNRRELKASIGILLFAALDLALALLAWNPPWEWMGGLGKNHLLHHLWVVSSLSLDITAYALFAVGATMLILVLKSPIEGRLKSVYHTGKTVVACCVLALIVACLFFEGTLSQSEGVENSLSQRIPALLNHRRDSIAKIELPAQTPEPLQYISDQIMKKGLLQRDLIITGSRLSVDGVRASESTEAEALPDDLYFYYDHKVEGATTECDRKRDPEVPVDTRFVPFGTSLLDVVIGSSSIYPLFPSRTLLNLQLPGNGGAKVEIIDGGFAHNSPIEAAVLWGATHIILIEASPEVSPTHQNFVDNVVAAFNHLYIQAQLADAHSRGKVEIYSLRPALAMPGQVPNLCVFDFSNILLQKAIADGRRDAFDESHPSFRRESGEPSFRETVSSNGCSEGQIER